MDFLTKKQELKNCKLKNEYTASQIRKLALTFLFISREVEENSIPTVSVYSVVNSFFMNLFKIEVLPTPNEIYKKKIKEN